MAWKRMIAMTRSERILEVMVSRGRPQGLVVEPKVVLVQPELLIPEPEPERRGRSVKVGMGASMWRRPKRRSKCRR